MCEKLKANNCDPARMQDAYDRMAEDCGFLNAGVYAGYMAENCVGSAVSVPCPVCTDDDENAPNIGALSEDIVLIYVANSNFPAMPHGTYKTLITKGTFQEDVEVSGGGEVFFGFKSTTYEGEEFNVQLVRTTDDVVLIDEYVNFTFNRGSNYGQGRNLVFDYVGGEFTLEFRYW